MEVHKGTAIQYVDALTFASEELLQDFRAASGEHAAVDLNFVI